MAARRRMAAGRRVTALATTCSVLIGAAVTVVAVSSARADPPADTDWSVALVESTIEGKSPEELGGWGYTQALYLYGQYLVYQRTKEKRYLDYIKTWLDRFVQQDGSIDRDFNNLDSMLGGNLMVAMHKETGEDRYRLAAEKIRKRLDTYPRTEDGGFWHGENRENQLWLDGAFMVLPFLARYGQEFDDADYAYDEAAKQLNIYFDHLQEPNGLLKHAYDEKREQEWADKSTGKSPEFWCRAIGWFGMAHIEVLDVLPENHPQRDRLISNLKHIAGGYEKFQDPQSGRWFQVVDKGDNPKNWTETSCSSMYTYVLSRGSERGYLDAHYTEVAAKGYKGVLEKVTLGDGDRVEISDISEGTNVEDLDYYLARERKTNDMHGLGAFLIMNEQLMRTSRPGQSPSPAGPGPGSGTQNSAPSGQSPSESPSASPGEQPNESTS